MNVNKACENTWFFEAREAPEDLGKYIFKRLDSEWNFGRRVEKTIFEPVNSAIFFSIFLNKPKKANPLT